MGFFTADELASAASDSGIIYPQFVLDQLVALFPQARVSVHVLWGLKQQNTVFAVGKSIIDRTSPADVGSLMLQYGGGGHEAAGTCQIANEHAEAIGAELVARLRQR